MMFRVVDLTLPLSAGERGVKIEQIRRFEKDGWNATTLNLYSHCGTHMDAPVHFGVDTDSIDTLGVDKLIGPAWVVDVRPIAPRDLIEVKDIQVVAERLEAGDGLLICTGWSEYYGRARYRDELPRISEELARWCVEKKVRILGVEPPSVADINSTQELTSIHRILFEGGVIVIEGLANLTALTKPKVTFIALPLKITDGDGAPARAIAVEDDV
jgi:kynurenine formamidase